MLVEVNSESERGARAMTGFSVAMRTVALTNSMKNLQLEVNCRGISNSPPSPARRKWKAAPSLEFQCKSATISCAALPTHRRKDSRERLGRTSGTSGRDEQFQRVLYLIGERFPRAENRDDDDTTSMIEPRSDELSERNDVATAEKDEYDEEGSEEEEGEKGKGVEELKQDLVNALYGTCRGMCASRETIADISELITQLEAQNPTPAPTEALTLLSGKWILAYTSFKDFFPFLAGGNLPMVKVGEISQTIDSKAFTVENSITLEGPYSTTSFSTCASFDVRSPKRVQIKFVEGIIGTPQLTDAIEIPESMEFLGQKINLKPLQGVLRPLEDAATSVGKRISDQPPLKFPYPANRVQLWLLTTYLDEDLRISHAENGGVFVLIKEGSPIQLLLNLIKEEC